MRRRLIEHGCEVTEVVDHTIVRSIYFTDPHGIALEASWWAIDATGRARELRRQAPVLRPRPGSRGARAARHGRAGVDADDRAHGRRGADPTPSERPMTPTSHPTTATLTTDRRARHPHRTGRPLRDRHRGRAGRLRCRSTRAGWARCATSIDMAERSRRHRLRRAGRPAAELRRAQRPGAGDGRGPDGLGCAAGRPRGAAVGQQPRVGRHVLGVCRGRARSACR